MAQRKRYEVRGMMEWHPEFRVGRGRLKVSFTGGHLSAGGCTPASFETADPVVQAVIEGSAAFARGLIMEGGHSDRRPVGPVAGTTVSKRVLQEFSTLGDAQDFLQSCKGLAFDEIATFEKCLDAGAKLGMELKIKDRSQ